MSARSDDEISRLPPPLAAPYPGLSAYVDAAPTIAPARVSMDDTSPFWEVGTFGRASTARRALPSALVRARAPALAPSCMEEDDGGAVAIPERPLRLESYMEDEDDRMFVASDDSIEPDDEDCAAIDDRNVLPSGSRRSRRAPSQQYDMRPVPSDDDELRSDSDDSDASDDSQQREFDAQVWLNESRLEEDDEDYQPSGKPDESGDDSSDEDSE